MHHQDTMNWSSNRLTHTINALINKCIGEGLITWFLVYTESVELKKFLWAMITYTPFDKKVYIT
jgi:hypothetical protein